MVQLPPDPEGRRISSPRRGRVQGESLLPRDSVGAAARYPYIWQENENQPSRMHWMLQSRSGLRRTALLGVWLLLVGGAADAANVGVCPHHDQTRSATHEGPSPDVDDPHSHASASHASAPHASSSHGSPSSHGHDSGGDCESCRCECRFLCLGSGGMAALEPDRSVSFAGVPPGSAAASVSGPGIELPLLPSASPHFLPFPNGPPVHV